MDTTKEPYELITSLILDDYRYIRNDISDTTTGMPLYHSILSGIALGDGRTHSVFKRAGVDEEIGSKAVDELCELGVIFKEKSRKIFTSWAEDYKVSDKLSFKTPFFRFWFAFVSPLFKGVRDGDYKEVQKRFLNKKAEFVAHTFEQLSLELLKIQFKDDPIVESGSYWDRDVDLEIFAKTKSGKTVAGVCRYSNSKLKKSIYTKLQEDLQKAKIESDINIFISKKGFSNEFKAMKNPNTKLLTLKHFSQLV